MKTLGILFATLALGLGACGGDTGTNTMTSSYSCCLNKAYYSCPSQAAADKCFSGGDSSGCTRDSSKDSSSCN